MSSSQNYEITLICPNNMRNRFPIIIERIMVTDARFVMIARDLATASGIIRKRNNALLMTKKGYFDIRPDVYEDMRSIDCYLFRTYQNFMELFGLVTTDQKWNREEN